MRNLILDRILKKYCEKENFLIPNHTIKSEKFLLRNLSKIIKDLQLTGNYSVTPQYILQRADKIRKYVQQKEELAKIPHVKQKSPEWFARRAGRISASDFGNALGLGMSSNSQKEFFKKKCGFEETTFSDFALSIMNRGNKLEDVAAMLYEYRTGIKITEFGLLPHPTDDRFGASPDGITEFGQCIEIKCPAKRKINGKPPIYYYFQMQGQMAVCGLDETDFIECNFYDYKDYNEYDNDWDETDTLSSDYKEKGIIIEYDIPSEYDENEIVQKWIYSKNGLSKTELKDFQDDTIIDLAENKGIDINNIRVNYWRLDQMLIQRLYRDDEFINKMFEDLDFIYNKIQFYKENPAIYYKEIGKPQDISTEARGLKKRKIDDSSSIITSPSINPTEAPKFELSEEKIELYETVNIGKDYEGDMEGYKENYKAESKIKSFKLPSQIKVQKERDEKKIVRENFLEEKRKEKEKLDKYEFIEIE
jgi:putative phage-type endonuclease